MRSQQGAVMATFLSDRSLLGNVLFRPIADIPCLRHAGASGSQGMSVVSIVSAERNRYASYFEAAFEDVRNGQSASCPGASDIDQQ